MKIAAIFSAIATPVTARTPAKPTSVATIAATPSRSGTARAHGNDRGWNGVSEWNRQDLDDGESKRQKANDRLAAPGEQTIGRGPTGRSIRPSWLNSRCAPPVAGTPNRNWSLAAGIRFSGSSARSKSGPSSSAAQVTTAVAPDGYPIVLSDPVADSILLGGPRTC